MAEGGRKRRKFADVSLKAELYVLHDKEHKVRSQEFDEWNDQVLKILDRAEKDIGVETNKFLQTHQGLGLGMQAPMDSQVKRLMSLDDNTP